MLGVSWKVPWYSAKKYSGTFYEVPWGLFEEMVINTRSVRYSYSQRHKVHLCKRTFFYTENIKTNLRREGFVMVKLVGIPDRLVVALLHDVLQVGTVGSVAPFRQFRKIDRLKESLASS